MATSVHSVRESGHARRMTHHFETADILSMEKCPKCGSLKTRKSSYQPQSEHKPWFSSWFRCQDCSARFLSTDQLLIQLWVMGAIALVVIAGAALWAVQHQSGKRSLGAATDARPAPSASAVEPEASLMRPDDLSPSIRQAAEARNPDAQYRLGLAILQRQWERGNLGALGDATEWLRQAAEQNHARAQFVIGVLYEKGRGVIQDYKEAMIWFRRAAEQGDPQAMSRLGRMMKAGHGVEKNLLEAYVWLNLASARGDQSAEIDRDRLRQILSSEQLGEAQNRSRRFDHDLPRRTGDSNDLPADF